MKSLVKLNRIVPVVVVLFCFSWIVFELNSSTAPIESFIPESWYLMTSATVVLICSLFLISILFYGFINAESSSVLEYSDAHELFFTGQLLRYLPGRIWGVAYQMSRTVDKISPICIARANIDLMLFSIGMNVALTCLIVGYKSQLPLLLVLIFTLLFLAGIAAFFLGGFNDILRRLAPWLPEKLSKALLTAANVVISPTRLAWLMLVFCASKILFLSSWWLLQQAFPALSHVDIIVVAMLYSIASIVGILSIVTPAGLGVREASFLLLGGGVASHAELAFIAIFARFWLMATELMLASASAFIFMLYRDSCVRTT